MQSLALEELRSLVHRTHLQGHALDAGTLEDLAAGLLAWSKRSDLSSFKRASASEELLYPLQVPEGGPAVYLVSDGTNSCSPPHEHKTWAVIVGLAGYEANRIYSVGPDRRLQLVGEKVVGPGHSLILEDAAVHSTRVAGLEPTFHIHIYGKALELLAPFSSRTFDAL